MHAPLRDGKLSWKEFFPNKMALGKMQDRFYGRVGALYGLSRGEKRGDGEPVKRHKSVAEYKAENLRIQAELDEKTKQLESVTAELAVVKDVLKTAQDAAKGALIQYINRVYLLGKKGERQWSEYTGTPSSTGLPARKSHMRGRTRLGADSEMARTTRRSGFRSVLFLTGGSPS